MQFLIKRDDQNARRTLGMFVVDGVPRWHSLELPWLEDQHNISCIAAGRGEMRLRFSPSHGYAVYGVYVDDQRDNVLVHIANRVADLLGCIGIGMARIGDAIVSSRVAFVAMMQACGCTDYQIVDGKVVTSLTSEDAVKAWLVAHPETARYSLEIVNPSPGVVA